MRSFIPAFLAAALVACASPAAVQGLDEPVAIVCATSLTRPGTIASTAIIELATDVIQRLVATKAWPARWVA